MKKKSKKPAKSKANVLPEKEAAVPPARYTSELPMLPSVADILHAAKVINGDQPFPKQEPELGAILRRALRLWIQTNILLGSVIHYGWEVASSENPDIFGRLAAGSYAQGLEDLASRTHFTLDEVVREVTGEKDSARGMKKFRDFLVADGGRDPKHRGDAPVTLESVGPHMENLRKHLVPRQQLLLWVFAFPPWWEKERSVINTRNAALRKKYIPNKKKQKT